MKTSEPAQTHFRVHCGVEGCDRFASAAPEDFTQIVISKAPGKTGRFALAIAQIPPLAKCPRADCGSTLSQNTTGHPEEIDWLIDNVDPSLVVVEGPNTPALLPRHYAEEPVIETPVLFPVHRSE